MKQTTPGRVRSAIALAVMALALTACDREPDAPNPTVDTPGPVQPGAAPPTTSGGLEGSVVGSLGGGVEPAPEAGRDLDDDTETASTLGGSAAAGVPDSDLAPPPSDPDVVRQAAGEVTAPGSAGQAGAGTTAGLPGTGVGADPGRDAGGAMSGGTGSTVEDVAPATGAPLGSDAVGAGGRSEELRQGGNADPVLQTHPLTRSESNFIRTAVAFGNFELAMARLGLERGQSKLVTQYAQMLAEQRAQANRELQNLALELGVVVPTDVPASKLPELERLSKARQEEFDRLFVQEVGLQAHREAIGLYEQALREAEQPRLRAHIENSLPMLRRHLQAAQRLPDAK